MASISASVADFVLVSSWTNSGGSITSGPSTASVTKIFTISGVPSGVTIAYGDGMFIIGAGDDAGKFTNTDNSSANPAVPGRFIGPAENGIAPAEIYHSDTAAAAANAAAAAGVAAAVAALKLGDLADVTLTSESDGEVLKYDGTDQIWENGTDETT